jgi:hypothetical protein
MTILFDTGLGVVFVSCSLGVLISSSYRRIVNTAAILNPIFPSFPRTLFQHFRADGRRGKDVDLAADLRLAAS